MFQVHHSYGSRHDAVEEPDLYVRERIIEGLRGKRIFHLLVIEQATSVQLPIVDVHFTAAIADNVKIHLQKLPRVVQYGSSVVAVF